MRGDRVFAVATVGWLFAGLAAAAVVALSGCEPLSPAPTAGDPASRPTTSALASSSFVPAGFGCVWHDEFGGDQGGGQPRADVDASSWSFQELNVNSEAQVYTTKQCSAYPNDWNYCVEDGRLRIQGRNETVVCDANGDGVADNPVCAPHYTEGFHASASYTSGRLMTKQKVHFHDGYLEFRVKLPDADRSGAPESGMWPAVWMLGEDINQGPPNPPTPPGGTAPPPDNVPWPNCGEVDVMEWSSNGGTSQQGWNAIWSGAGGTNACSAWPQGGNVACGPCPPTGGQCVGEVTNGANYEMTGWTGFDNHAWHTYGFRWDDTGDNTTDQMTYFIDGVKMGVFKLGAAQSAFKNDMFLTVNMALGGTLGGPIQITDWANAYLDVDYVRWYRNGQTDTCGFGAQTDAGAEAGVDAAVDAGVDVGLDASVDVATEARADSGAGASDAAPVAPDAPIDSPPLSICGGKPNGTSCDDGNACNGHETCQAGACTAGTSISCPAAQGLSGAYFDNADLTGQKLTRVDATVSFNWGTGSPDPSIGVDTFSVRWTGSVTPLYGETYTFYAKTDDGVRLWVNGQELVNRWVNQGATEASGTIALAAGQPYALVMEYYENAGSASAQLSWSSAHQAKQIVPQTALGATTPPPPPPPPPPTVSFPLKINFEPSATAIPAGYVADAGDVFGPRTGGASYGWNVSHASYMRRRGVNADARLDTLAQFHVGGTWEVAVPNGTYNVLVSVGDPSYASTYTLNVEGVSYWAATPIAVNHFQSAKKAVTVTDGRLTLDEGKAGDMATRLDYIEISQ